ncbi:Protein of unknown function, partial [Cotesia congregata]
MLMNFFLLLRGDHPIKTDDLSRTYAIDYSKVNVVGRCEDFLPSKKLSELEVNNIYVISDVKSVKAKYGNTIIVSIDNEFS